MQIEPPVAQGPSLFRQVCGVCGAINAPPSEIVLGGNPTLRVKSELKRAAERPATVAAGGETS